MRIKALENWEYVPEFAGNRKQKANEQTVYTFRVLSGKDDLTLRKEGKEAFPDSLEAIIVSVKNPPIIVNAAGKETTTEVKDLSLLPELRAIYLELIIEYGSHSALDQQSGKP
ncbi:MAG: hypothetical protein DRI69_10390 [Bacteroidetes bacterium]|nr:MAG: hypothetical protein DRI69_10390 [Bacteroidota bacterium]